MFKKPKSLSGPTFLILIAAGFTGAFFLFRHFSVESLWNGFNNIRDYLTLHYEANRTAILIIYVLTYTIAGAFCLPGTGFLNLTGAGMFGPVTGLTAICLSRAAGGTIACLAVRKLFGEKVRKNYGDRLSFVYRGFAEEGGFYLFALRLAPGLPYPITNMAMGLTTIKLSSFFWITMAGSVPGTLVSINAARQIKNVSTPSDMFSPWTIFSLTLIGIMPLLLKKIISFVRNFPPRKQRSI